MTLGDIGIDFSVEEPEDLLTATFANRNFNQGDILRLYTGFAGLSATEISFYFSDGYEFDRSLQRRIGLLGSHLVAFRRRFHR